MTRKSLLLLDWESRFESDPAVIFVLDSDFRLRYCNEAWDRFAMENGAVPQALRDRQIGRSVMEAMPAPLKRFYARLYAQVLFVEPSADHEYECSSAEIFRRFHMSVQRLDVAGESSFLLVVNSLLVEEPFERPSALYSSDALRQEDGLITMCCHCRRTRVPGGEDLWVWVPGLVREMPPDVSHGICPICFDIHYGQLR